MANEFSFGRKWLTDIVQDEELTVKEKVQKIVDGHLDVLTPVKDERDSYKTQAADLQKQIEGLQSGENWQEKYEKEHQAFEDFKKQTTADAEAAKVKEAYRKLLADEKISEKRIDSIMRVTDFSKMKLDKEGKLAGEDDIRKAIGDEWGEFRTTVTEKGAKVETPPKTSSGKMTKDEIMKIADTSARQKAIAENLDLFQ